MLQAYELALWREMFRAATHAVVYFRRRLPDELLTFLSNLRLDRGRGSVEAVVEEIGDVGYLRSLHGAGLALYYGIGLPERTFIIIDRKHAFSLDESALASLRLRPLARGEDIYLALLWHRFGMAASLVGEVTERNRSRAIFCMRIEGKWDQWCRLKDPASQQLPQAGDRIDAFGWAKWNTRITEILDCRVATERPPL